MKEHTFDRLLRGPSIITKIRNEVNQSSDETSVSASVDKILTEEGYSLSLRQQQLMEQSLPIADHNRDAIRRAKWLHRHQPHVLPKRTAHLFEITPDEVGTLTFHEGSITAVIPNDAIKIYCDRINQQYEVDAYRAENIAGMANRIFKVKAQGLTLPVSVQNKRYDDKVHTHVPEHENLHTHYRYLHPNEDSDEFSDPSDQEQRSILETLREDVTEVVTENNFDAFIEIVRQINYDQLALYLNELSSEALTNRHNALVEAFGSRENDHPYSKVYYKLIDTLKEEITKHADTILPWIEIILRESELSFHRASYIQEAYDKLLNQGKSPEELIAIAEFLTPEQGYIIQAFVDGNPTFSKMKKWKNEYEQPVWATDEYPREQLLLKAVNIDPEVYDDLGVDNTPYLKLDQILETSVSKKKKKSILMYELEKAFSRNPDSENDSISVVFDFAPDFRRLISRFEEIQHTRINDIQNLLTATSNKKHPTNAEDQEFLYNACVDFDNIFTLCWETEQHTIRIPPIYELQQAYIEEQMKILRMSLSMDSAREDLIEKLKRGENVNLTEYINPDYISPNERQEYLYERIMSAGSFDQKRDDSLEDNEFSLLNAILISGVYVSPEELADIYEASVETQKNMRRLISLCMRSIVWANEHKKPMKPWIKEFVKNALPLHVMPQMIHERVKEEYLGTESDDIEKIYI